MEVSHSRLSRLLYVFSTAELRRNNYRGSVEMGNSALLMILYYMIRIILGALNNICLCPLFIESAANEFDTFIR